MRLYGLLGGEGKYVSVCKAGKLGGSGGHVPLGNFDLDVLIWWNLGLFSHTQLFTINFIATLKLL